MSTLASLSFEALVTYVLQNRGSEGLQLHLKKRLKPKCFPVKFAKFLKIPFLIEHLRW